MSRSPSGVATVAVCGLAIAALGLLTLARTLRQDCSPMPSVEGVGWLASLGSVEEALANKDFATARRALECARRAAYAGREWRALLLVGTTAIRIGALEGHDVGRWQGRRDYLEALLGAYRGKSLDGVLESAQAFAALGDRDVVAQAMRMANELAGKDVEARDRVRAFGERFTRTGSYPEDCPAGGDSATTRESEVETFGRRGAAASRSRPVMSSREHSQSRA